MGIIVSAIAAMSRNRVIGAGNKLPWYLPEDFQHFKRTTMGKPVIMGRKTFESLSKPLPGRTNIVITRSSPVVADGMVVVSSLDLAIKAATDIAIRDGVDEIFVIGGGQIYEAAMPILDRIYLTVIDHEYEGDTHFPHINPVEWTENIIQSGRDPMPYTITILDRKK